jgi:hypothetical protein
VTEVLASLAGGVALARLRGKLRKA